VLEATDFHPGAVRTRASTDAGSRS
jgi:hypothetical protein